MPEILPRPAAELISSTTPFSRAQALAAGISPDKLKWLLSTGVLRRVLRGVYIVSTARETIATRAAALRFVVPARAVVVDETAGWLHGAHMILAPSQRLEVPSVHVFHRDGGCRLRRDVTASGERRLLDRDVTSVDGILVTTPLRTACDLGRLRLRDQALAAIDSLLRLDTFEYDDLMREVARFPGYRGVIQLRALAPLADGRSESPGESALRLRWLDANLPRPCPQHVVHGPRGQEWRFDLADPPRRYAAEYDGERHHTLLDDVAHDEERRWFLVEQEGWTIDALRRTDVYGLQQQAERILRRGHARAVARHEGR